MQAKIDSFKHFLNKKLPEMIIGVIADSENLKNREERGEIKQRQISRGSNLINSDKGG